MIVGGILSIANRRVKPTRKILGAVEIIVVGREKDTQELSCEDFHHRVKVYLGHNNDSIFVIDNIKSHSIRPRSYTIPYFLIIVQSIFNIQQFPNFLKA